MTSETIPEGPALGPQGSLDEPCPNCGHRPIARIVRGMPAGPPTADEEDYIFLGGCVVSGDDPSHRCANCYTQFWADGRVRGPDDPFPSTDTH